MSMRNFRVILGSLFAAILLYQALGPEVPMMHTLAVIGLLMIPFLMLNHELAERALVAVLTLTLPFNVDQALFLREAHVGGSQGLILSLNGICITLLYLMTFIQNFQGRKETFYIPRKLTLLFLGILVMCLLSMFNAKDRTLSLFEMLEVNKMFFIFIYMVNYARKRKNFHWILIFLVIGVAFEGSIAFLQRVTQSTLNLKILGADEESPAMLMQADSTFRVGGTLGGANALAWYLDYLLPVIIGLLFFKKKSQWQFILLCICGLAGLALIITLSRGGWLGFAFGLMLMILFLIRKVPVVLKFYSMVFVTLFIMLSVVLLFGIDNPIKARFTAKDDGSAESRIPLMQIAYNMIKAQPLIGHGVNNYVLVDHEYDNTSLQTTTHFHYPVHNFYLQTAVEIGLPGLFFFLGFGFLMMLRLYRLAHHSEPLYRFFGIGVLGGFAAAGVQGLVENCCIGNYILLPFWYLSAVTEGVLNSEPIS